MSDNGLYDGTLEGLVQGMYDGANNGSTNGTSDNTLPTPKINVVSDYDALLYLNKASITSPVERNAMNLLFKRLKANNLYSNLTAFFPFLGSVINSCKYNAINPLDTDAAFRLSLNGGLTKVPGGVQTNGTTGYADTFIKPATNFLSTSRCGFGMYYQTDISHVASLNMQGVITTSGGNKAMFIGFSADTAQVYLNKGSSVDAMISIPAADTKGHWYASRIGNAQFTQQNGVTIATKNNSLIAASASNFYLFARNVNGVATFYNEPYTLSCAYFTRNGYTQAEATLFNKILTDFLISIGRKV